MASSGYTAITFIANEQPTTAKWNLIGSNDASFNTGDGFEDGIIINRHLDTDVVKQDNIDFADWPAIVTGTSGSTTLAMTIPGNGYVLVWGGGRIGTATATVSITASGTAVLASALMPGMANDADYVHIPVGGTVKVQAGSLTLTLNNTTDNRGIAAIYIPVITSTTF